MATAIEDNQDGADEGDEDMIVTTAREALTRIEHIQMCLHAALAATEAAAAELRGRIR